MATVVPDLAINLATLREQYDFRGSIDACVRHGISAVAPWRAQLAKAGVTEVAKILRDNGMTATGLCRGGMFTVMPDALDDNRRAVDEAAAIGAQSLVLVVGGLP